MRWLSLIALATACASEQPSSEDRLDDLLAKTEIVCGHYADLYPCPTTTPPSDAILECMNDALASGRVARWSRASRDNQNESVLEYVFAVDHQVKAFTKAHDPVDPAAEPQVSEGATCAGPFRLAEPRCAGSDVRPLAWSCGQ